MTSTQHSEEEWGETVDDANRWRVGVSVDRQPGDTEVKDVLYLVAYDVSSPKRLRRVAKLCEAYGVRVEKSVFECDLRIERFDAFWCELIDLIDHDEDALVAYRVCRACVREIESMGTVTRPERQLLYCL